MFLQSQKTRSNIKYKTSEKPRKKKKKTGSKIKPKEPESNNPKPKEPEEAPIPSNIQPSIQEPEIPLDVFQDFKEPEPFDNSNNVKSDMRFNKRQDAKFGLDDEESEGPDLFMNSKAKAEEVNKPANFTSLGEKSKRQKYRSNKSGRDHRSQNSNLWDKPGSRAERASEGIKPEPGPQQVKKKKNLINIFEEASEKVLEQPKASQGRT
jgi:hypothetical protein